MPCYNPAVGALIRLVIVLFLVFLLLPLLDRRVRGRYNRRRYAQVILVAALLLFLLIWMSRRGLS